MTLDEATILLDEIEQLKEQIRARDQSFRDAVAMFAGLNPSRTVILAREDGE